MIHPVTHKSVSTGQRFGTGGSLPPNRRQFLNQALLGTGALFTTNALRQVAAAQQIPDPTEAARQFDQLVESYYFNQPGTREGLQQVQQRLSQVPANVLNPKYQGMHMLFDHHLQRRIFDLEEGPALRKMGIDLTPRRWNQPRPRLGKPTGRLLEEGIGKHRYDAILKLDNFVNLDAESLTRLAKQQYDQLEAEMKAVARQIDPRRDWREIYMDLRKQHPSKAELLNTYRREVESAKAFFKAQDLMTFPQEHLNVEETPAHWRSAIPFAAYFPGRGASGTFVVTTVVDDDPAKIEEQLRAHSDFFIPPVAIHEAFPGHHLQHVHDSRVPVSENNPSQSTFARLINLTPRSTFFIEGWGVYTEELARERGYYTKPEQHLFALRNLLWRAARAYLDPQIHTGKIQYNQAVDFLVNNVLMERDRAEIEVNRYYQRPTEVTSYMVGKLQIQALRRAMEARGRFSLKGFHDSLLSGKALPVPVIAKMQFNAPADLPAVQAAARRLRQPVA